MGGVLAVVVVLVVVDGVVVVVTLLVVDVTSLLPCQCDRWSVFMYRTDRCCQNRRNVIVVMVFA